MINDYSFLDKPYAFAVCRIEPENNTHMLLEAFADNPPFPIVIVGNWRYKEYGRNLKEQYRDCPNTYLIDPIYEQKKLNQLRQNCYVYLHGHSCGGTNPSLVEAMYLALPVIAFDVPFNRETTENQALFFDSTATLKNLCATLDEAKRSEIAGKMKEIADRRYTWERISELYYNIF